MPGCCVLGPAHTPKRARPSSSTTLLLALIAVVAIGTLTFLGHTVSNTLNNVANNLEAVGEGGGGTPGITFSGLAGSYNVGGTFSVTVNTTGLPLTGLTIGDVVGYDNCASQQGGGVDGPSGNGYPCYGINYGANQWATFTVNQGAGTITITANGGGHNIPGYLGGWTYEFLVTATNASGPTTKTITVNIN